MINDKEKIINHMESALRLVRGYEFEHPESEKLEQDETAIAFIVGHTKTAKGAYSDYFKQSEYDFWSSRMPNFKEACEAYKITKSKFYRDHIGVSGAYKEADIWLRSFKNKCIIELHFNAYNKVATGTETLYVHDTAFEGMLAKGVNDSMVECLGLRNRGAKDIKKGAAGYQNVTRVSDYPSILIEPGFFDNPNDCKAFEKNESLFYRAVVKAVKESYSS